jgi:hypothetical protein
MTLQTIRGRWGRPLTGTDDAHEGSHNTTRDRAAARAARLRTLMRTASPARPAVTPLGEPGALEPRDRQRRRAALVIGGVLIAVGALTFVALLGGVSPLSLAIFASGVLLVTLALGWRPLYVLYLAGLGLAGWGAGAIVDRAIGSPMFLSAVGLGCGLCFAWLIRRAQAGRAHLWPLLFGVFFAGFGVLAGFNHPREVAWHAWPLLLVAAGVALVLRVLLPTRRGVGRPPRL